MQAKPLTVTISAETGRDHLAGATTAIVDAIMDANPHLQFISASSHHNGAHITERRIVFRPVAEAAE